MIPFMGKQGDEGFERKQVGGSAGVWRVCSLLLLGRALKKGRRAPKESPGRDITMATTVPRLQLARKQVVLLRRNSLEAPRELRFISPVLQSKAMEIPTLNTTLV